jgi:hypothetical protein
MPTPPVEGSQLPQIVVDDPDVVILVRGGVAEVVKNRGNFNILIVDFDNLREGGDAGIICPVCTSNLQIDSMADEYPPEREGFTILSSSCHQCNMGYKVTYWHMGRIEYEPTGPIIEDDWREEY